MNRMKLEDQKVHAEAIDQYVTTTTKHINKLMKSYAEKRVAIDPKSKGATAKLATLDTLKGNLELCQLLVGVLPQAKDIKMKPIVFRIITDILNIIILSTDLFELADFGAAISDYSNEHQQDIIEGKVGAITIVGDHTFDYYDCDDKDECANAAMCKEICDIEKGNGHGNATLN
jgi:hypothetical protein